MVFTVLNSQTLNWTLTDSSLVPISDATVTATLYSGRDINNTAILPGTPVTYFDNLSLAYSANGLYSGTIDPRFNPPLGGGYVLVVDVTRPGGTKSHWEEPSVVAQRQD